MITLPQSTPFRERYVKVIAKIQTWCIVEDIITFDTETNQFEIPNGELADAAVAYAMRGYWKKRMWPFRGDGFKPSTAEWPDGRIRDLVKAGALIAAEIDRLLNLKK